MTHSRTRPRGAGERGSALLIVFVFAAMIAIALYAEMPVTLFEAKRQKEQILVDRGHEYVRAVQLFYRRNRGQYPVSIEQLENTNNIRYLRKRYVDPFTGKGDWRLLHAGPGGMLTDSKVKRSLPGTTGASGQTTPGSSSSPHDAGPGAFGADTSSFDAGVTVAAVPQRAPAVQAGPGANGSSVATTAQLDQNPNAPVLPATNSGMEVDTTAAAPRRTARGEEQSDQSNVMQNMSPLLNNPTQTPSAQTNGQTGTALGAQRSSFGSTTSGSMGQLNAGGGLAGVASKVKGPTIKVIGDQTDYALWEFYYDPSKDTGISGGAGQIQPIQNRNGTNNGTNAATPSAAPNPASAPATTLQATPSPDQLQAQPTGEPLQAQPQQ